MTAPEGDGGREQRAAEAVLADLRARAAGQAMWAAENPDPDDVYDDFTVFYDEYLAPNMARAPGDVEWCPQWMAHDEAVMVVRALHESWEVFNRGGDIAGWLATRAYYCMDRLWSERGTFKGCIDGGHDPRALAL